jgi:hypothetical protein
MDIFDYLFGGGLEDDLRSTGRWVDSNILQPVVQNITQLVENPRALASIAVNLAFPGLGAAVGSSVLGLVGASSNAIASALIGNTLINTALNKGDIRAGLLQAVGTELGGLAAKEVSKLVDTSEILGRSIVRATEGAIKSGFTGLARNEDPLKALLTGGLSAGLASSVLDSISLAMKDTPGLSVLDSKDPFTRAARSALGAAISGESGSKAFSANLIGSVLSLGKPFVNDLFNIDEDAPTIQAGKEMSEARQKLDEKSGPGTRYGDALSTANTLADGADIYLERVQPIVAQLSKDIDAHLLAGAVGGNNSWYANTRYRDFDRRKAEWDAEYNRLTNTKSGYVNEYINNYVTPFNAAMAIVKEEYPSVKPLEAAYDTALTKFETQVGKFQTQELQNTAFLSNMLDNVSRAKDLFRQARGTELPDDALADYIPKVTRTDLSPPEPEALTRLINEVEVKRINPEFNPEIFVKANDLKTTDPYKAYLDYGRQQGMISSKPELDMAISAERTRLINQAADVAGLASGAQLPQEVTAAMSRSLDEQYGSDLNKWKDASLKSWDDIGGLKLNTKESQDLNKPTVIDVSGVGTIAGLEGQNAGELRQGLEAELSRIKMSAPSGLRLGTEAELANGTATEIVLPNGVRAVVVDERSAGQLPKQDVDPVALARSLEKDEDLAKFVSPLMQMMSPEERPPAPGEVKPLPRTVADILKDIGARESNLPKVIPQFIKDAYDSTQTAQGVGIKAFGNILQSFNGLVTLAGINPKTTPLGKLADSLIEVGKAKTSEEYQTAVKSMSENLAKAQGVGGAAKAIWENFKNTPVEFLSEVVISEGLQEIVPLLIGGGATTFARGLALARGMGTTAAQRIGARTGLAAAGVSDIAESAGGSAAGAFEEAYNIATKKLGMSEAEATNVALDVASRSGTISALVTATTLGLGGQALEKALIGGTGRGTFANAIDEIAARVKQGGTITLREGVTEGIEEGITTAFTESQLYKLDPTRDVGANIASSAILGAIAGGGISGGAYGASAGRDILSNVLSQNPQVRQIVDNAPDAAAAETQLGQLGISVNTSAELLNPRFDDQYVSSQESYDALRTNTGFAPSDADVAQFTGKRPEATLADDVTKYIDPRVVTEQEARNAYADIGITNPTQAEIDRYTGQRDQLQTIRDIQSEVGPQATTTSEADALFKQLGYTAKPEELTQFTGRVSDADAKTKIEQYVDPRQVTTQEVQAEMTRLGYTPPARPTSWDVGTAQALATRKQYAPQYDWNGDGRITSSDVLNLQKASQGSATDPPAAGVPFSGTDELAQFVRQGADVSQQDLLKQISTFVDPKVLDIQEVKDAAAAEGYTLTDEQARALAGQRDEATAITNLRSAYDPLAVTEQEARDAFAAQGYTPSAADLAKYIGMRNEGSTLSDIVAFADPKAVTNAEARQFFADLGYVPTDAEVSQFVKVADESGINTAVRQYVDPRQVTRTEAAQMFRDLGYTPTEDDFKGFVKQGADVSQEQIKSLLDQYVDPRMVDEAEVRAAYKALGLETPKQADVDRLVGQYAETELGGRAETALPVALYNLSQEQIAGKATKADIDTAISNIKFPAGISKEDVSTIVQNAFDANPGLSKADVQGVVDAAIKLLPAAPTIADITAAFTETTKTFATKADIDTAISNIKFPPGISKEDVTTAITDYMTKNPGLTLEQVATKITDATAGLATTEAVKTAIGDALKGYATTADINTAIANIKFPPGLSKEDVTKAITDYMTKNPGLTLEQVAGKIGDAVSGLATTQGVKDAISTALTTYATKEDVTTGLGNVKDAVLAKLGEYELAGIARDDAIGLAISDLADELGLSEQRITDLIGTPSVADDPSTPANEAKPATGIYEALERTDQNIADTRDLLANVLGTPAVQDDPATPENEAKPATGLYRELGLTRDDVAGLELDILGRLGEYEDAGIARDDALQRAFGDTIGTPSVQDDPNTPQNEAKPATGVYSAIETTRADVQASQDAVIRLMGEYEKAGLSRDQALQLAIGNVATQLGTTEQALTGRLTGIEQVIGRPRAEPTQADLDYITQTLAAGQTPDVTYDVTGDKKVDEADRLAIYNYIMRVPGAPPPGAPEGTVGEIAPFLPAATSRWAPTGLFGELASGQAALQKQIADEAEATRAANQAAALRNQRMGNLNTMMQMLGQSPDVAGQQVTVKAPDPLKLGYVYDWGSIFANPQQEKMFATPYAEGGPVKDPLATNSELLKILRG